MRRIPWLALAALGGVAGLRLVGLLAPWLSWTPGCPIKQATGWACPTCGLTRGVLALGQGAWREALHWYPGLLLLVVVAPGLALWDLRRAWRRDPYPSLPDSTPARLAAWLFLLGLWAVQVARGI